jgi:hypothetical protein
LENAANVPMITTSDASTPLKKMGGKHQKLGGGGACQKKVGSTMLPMMTKATTITLIVQTLFFVSCCK